MKMLLRMPPAALGVSDHAERVVLETSPAGSVVAAAAAADPPAMPGSFLRALCAEMTPESAARWEAFEDPRASAVVTGQQPGCLGGPLLVLYKAATAVALAARLQHQLERPVVPVFWNAADDVDFDEIARVSWPLADGELVQVELPRAARRAQEFVGRIPFTAVAQVRDAVLRLVHEPVRSRLAALLPAAARDHGDWVGRWLEAVFPDLAVLDARSPALRRHAAPLFQRYLDNQEAAAARVEGEIERLGRLGLPATLSAASLRSGLFLTPDGVRLKSDRPAVTLRDAASRTPEALSPNVMLRPLVQDEVLPTRAQVVGPAEVGYLLELRGLRELLAVREVALVPRLHATVLRDPEVQALHALSIDLEDALRDPDAALRAVAAARSQPERQALEATGAQFEASLRAQVRSEAGRKRLERGMKRVRTFLDDLAQSLEAESRDRLVEAQPALRGLPARLRPRGRPQERVLAASWLLGLVGEAAPSALTELAGLHLETMERGDLEHYAVSFDAEGNA